MDPEASRAESGVEAEEDYLRRGTPELRRANLALLVAGLATFAMLYAPSFPRGVFNPSLHSKFIPKKHNPPTPVLPESLGFGKR